MAERLIRIGRVSSVNAAKGMVSVTYPDLDNSTTGEFPVFSFTDEYKMPNVGSQVLHDALPIWIVLGRYWNGSNVPPVSSGFRKEMGDNFGSAYMEYDGSALTIHASKIILDGEVETDGSITVPAKGDVTVGAISLKSHKHTDSVSGKTSEPE